MATQFLNFAEKPLNFEKFKNNPKKSNQKSLWAFLLSIFLYISVFYLFKLSPSALFCTTKFWFIITNTLILIIAADFGAFFSSKEHDLYEEYVIRNKMRTGSTAAVPSSLHTPCMDNHQETKRLNDHTRQEVDDEPPEEKIIETAVVSVAADRSKNHEKVENKPKTFVTKAISDRQAENLINERFEKRKTTTSHVLVENGRAPNHEKKSDQAKYCVSDKAILKAAVSAKNEEKMVLQRTMSERRDKEPRSEDQDELYSKMSDEELNRRVEEFIRNFNRQIRLQAARDYRSRQSNYHLDAPY